MKLLEIQNIFTKGIGTILSSLGNYANGIEIQRSILNHPQKYFKRYNLEFRVSVGKQKNVRREFH